MFRLGDQTQGLTVVVQRVRCVFCEPSHWRRTRPWLGGSHLRVVPAARKRARGRRAARPPPLPKERDRTKNPVLHLHYSLSSLFQLQASVFRVSMSRTRAAFIASLLAFACAVMRSGVAGLGQRDMHSNGGLSYWFMTTSLTRPDQSRSTLFRMASEPSSNSTGRRGYQSNGTVGAILSSAWQVQLWESLPLVATEAL